eukprot:9208687-Lingulodinium_polyedra.AAC.1
MHINAWAPEETKNPGQRKQTSLFTGMPAANTIHRRLALRRPQNCRNNRQAFIHSWSHSPGGST